MSYSDTNFKEVMTMLNFDRFSNKKYPSFDEYISNKLITEVFSAEFPIELAESIVDKIRHESGYILNQKTFFLELQSVLAGKIRKTFYYDDSYAIDTAVNMIISRMGEEHLYVIFQYVLSVIARY